MTGVRFADVQARPAEFLNLTSLTLEEFEVLVAPFEAAFQDPMAAWRLDGKPRTSRRFTVYRTCPLATPEDRLFFLLTYLKTYADEIATQHNLQHAEHWYRTAMADRQPEQDARAALDEEVLAN